MTSKEKQSYGKEIKDDTKTTSYMQQHSDKYE